MENYGLLLDTCARRMVQPDYTVALALLYISIVLLLIGYLISDVLLTLVDPRIRVS